MSFQEQKKQIDVSLNSVKQKREPLDPGITDSSWKYDYADASKETLLELKQDIHERFEDSLAKSTFDIFHYNQLDQGSKEACTLASLFNLIHVTGNDDMHVPENAINQIRWDRAKNKWKKIKEKKYWRDYVFTNIKKNQPFQYYADLIDSGVDAKIENKPIQVFQKLISHPSFRYMPIRGDAYRELKINEAFFTNSQKSQQISRFGKDVVKKNPVISAVGNFIESKLDAGILVGISYKGHARIAVAYNDEDMLFADSHDHQIGYNERTGDEYVDGLSISNKYMIYAYAKDMVYFDLIMDSLSAMFKQWEL